MNSLHTPFAAWCRDANLRRNYPSKTKYRCPYANCQKASPTRLTIVMHIKESTPETDGALNYSETLADGWKDGNFKWQKPTELRELKNFRFAIGMTFSSDKELETPQVEVQDYQVLKGAVDMQGIEEQYGGSVINGADASYW